MGIYYRYACCDANGTVVAQFNPQRGFGMLKWGEFVGTHVGSQMLQLLRRRFCPQECRWGIVSDAGFVDGELCTVSIDGIALYELAEVAPDFALNPELRKIAIDARWTSQAWIDKLDTVSQFWDVLDEAPVIKPACMSELNQMRNQTSDETETDKTETDETETDQTDPNVHKQASATN